MSTGAVRKIPAWTSALTLGLFCAGPSAGAQVSVDAQANPDVTPVLSACDLKGIREVFSWFYNGEPPHASTVSSVTC